jgi:hypothetical protein
VRWWIIGKSAKHNDAILTGYLLLDTRWDDFSGVLEEWRSMESKVRNHQLQKVCGCIREYMVSLSSPGRINCHSPGIIVSMFVEAAVPAFSVNMISVPRAFFTAQLEPFIFLIFGAKYRR